MSAIEGYYKVETRYYADGCTRAVFFNPITYKQEIVLVEDKRDFTRKLCMIVFFEEPINDDVRKIWLIHKPIEIGDSVEVVKGKTVKKGTRGKVSDIYPIYNKYKKEVARYVEIDGIYNISVDNCKLVVNA